jgi:hypothetical protein
VNGESTTSSEKGGEPPVQDRYRVPPPNVDVNGSGLNVIEAVARWTFPSKTTARTWTAQEETRFEKNSILSYQPGEKFAGSSVDA